MRQLIRSTIAIAALAVGAMTLAASPAGASYQGTTSGTPVVISIDCLSILSRVNDLNEMVDALNEAGNDDWDSWRNGDISNDEMMGNIRDYESAADQVEDAYGDATVAWGAKGCKGSLPPLNSWDFPWRDLGIGG